MTDANEYFKTIGENHDPIEYTGPQDPTDFAPPALEKADDGVQAKAVAAPDSPAPVMMSQAEAKHSQPDESV